MKKLTKPEAQKVIKVLANKLSVKVLANTNFKSNFINALITQ